MKKPADLDLHCSFWLSTVQIVYEMATATYEEASWSGSTLSFLTINCTYSVWDGNIDPNRLLMKDWKLQENTDLQVKILLLKC